MPIPDYQTLMLPVLEALADGGPKTAAQLREAVAPKVGVTADERLERIPSGAPLYDNRVHWAVTYLVQAQLLRRPRRGVIQLTDRGRKVLESNPKRVDNHLLEQFEEFRSFRERATQRASKRETKESAVDDTVTPKERLSDAVEEANTAVAGEVIERLRAREPAFLEEVVLRLLTALGYGGREGAAEHLGGPHDQGLDGVIRQDALGLDRVYVQAKRFGDDTVVGRPHVQAFIGALHGAQADRGVFITTSRFSPDAVDYADRVAARVVLLDGQELGRLMVKHNIGVEDEEAFVLKRMDEDFFEGA